MSRDQISEQDAEKLFEAAKTVPGVVTRLKSESRRVPLRHHQATLFDVLDRLPATDPNVSKSARRRLSGQNKKILELLKSGPVRLRDLIAVASKYTSRISDLRKAGCVIDCQEQPDGNSLYTLKFSPPDL